MYSILVLCVAFPVALYFYFTRRNNSGEGSQSARSISKASESTVRANSKKAKAKAKKQAKKLEDAIAKPKEVFEEAPKEVDKKGTVEKVAPREEPQVNKAEPISKPTPEPVEAIPETTSSKKKKKKSSAKTKVEATPAVVETPAPTPELIREDAPETNGVDSEPSDFVEAATKSKKKKNKKPNVNKNEEAPTVTESILPEPKEFEFTDEPEFTKPAKVNVAKPSNRYVKGVSERKPIESANPWALLAED
ncbi:hypothetical protein L0F63_004692 [Massospora cicadina]|nr:hypothetical protein L0F63_004692 [Massospora cicadina]